MTCLACSELHSAGDCITYPPSSHLHSPEQINIHCLLRVPKVTSS